MRQNLDQDNSYTVIVGAGISGLTAAANLAAAGEKVVVLEKTDKLGGLCRSINFDGIAFDLGPHLFFYNPDCAPDRFLMDLFQPDELIHNPYKWAIHSKGVYWPMPLSPLALLFRYPWRYKIEIMRAVLAKKTAVDADERSLRFALEKKMGRSLYMDLFEPMLQKKTGLAGSALHRDWTLRLDRDVNNRPKVFTGFDKVITLRRKLEIAFSPTYCYPKNGFQAIAEKLGERVRQNGGHLIMECGALSLNTRGNQVREVVAKDQRWAVKNLVWTASVKELYKALGIEGPCFRFKDIAIVLLTYDCSRVCERPYVFTYHNDQGIIFNRVYFPRSIYRASSSPDREGFCAEILLDGENQNLSNDELIARTAAGIETLQLSPRSALRQGTVYRLKDCMPIYDLDYEKELSSQFAAIHEFDNLYSIGRSGGFFFCLTPAAINQGLQMADHLLNNGQPRPE